MLEHLFLGVNGTKTWLDVALLKKLEFNLNLYLILDVSPYISVKNYICGH